MRSSVTAGSFLKSTAEAQHQDANGLTRGPPTRQPCFNFRMEEYDEVTQPWAPEQP